MAAKSPKKSAPRSPHSKKEAEALKALEQAARRLGLKVSASSGQLRFAGLKLRGGSCLLRGNTWLILDKNQPFEELVDIYRQAISSSDLFAAGLPDDVVSTLAPYFLSEAPPAA
jgi:hypothetical protein